ncbi:class E sortase [Actinokineospora diospyrosa]|uniref:class E sortase n=1 Tax=Actinokineospora diospyrosa TaxID=103728 RepID=UPI0020A2345B|nr:class E sortase [Actinokineospora diospyrosa]
MRKASTGAVIVRSIGEAMVTLGIVVLLFVVYEVWVTDLMSAEKQEDVTVALDEQWQQPTVADPQRQQKFEFADGEGMAKLYIPALGEDYHFTVVEGTSVEDLETGPGHYKKSALPGQPGNFAVAGHRVGKGAPFNDLDLLNACDAMVVETQSTWYVYRMLPTTDDAKNWAAKSTNPHCAGVAPQTGEYARAVGRQIVTPAQSEVVAPVPGNPAAKTPAEQRQKMITLTTCHPKFSNRQRMILHGVLVREQAKNPADLAAVPAELRETG